MQQLHAFWSQGTEKSAHTGNITLRPTETIDEAHLDRVRADYEDNRNRLGRCLRSKCRWDIGGIDRGHIPPRQFGRKGR